MQFDDRLATVLRMQAGNERSAHTQYRQLLDLAGSAPEGADDALLKQAYARLEELGEAIDPRQRAAMIREPGMRLRNLELVDFLANQELPGAAATMAAARLSEAQWDVLIPTLPVPARALLRHRKNLPPRTGRLLARLGVGDLVLPEPPEGYIPPAPVEAAALPPMELDPALALDEEASEGIRAIVRRIEAFQRARRHETPPSAPEAPRLPLGEQGEDSTRRTAEAFDFETDAEGRIAWADPSFAPMASGMMLAAGQPEAPVQAGARMLAAIRHRQPLRAERVSIVGAPDIAGEWQIDAAPYFSGPNGRFAGYRGRMRRPAGGEASATSPADDGQGDRIRVILHELRTPVNAIQGFAEIIQQQMFGPTPNEYRALAASIAGDAARMLAGFDELDRLVKLEAGALELEEGSADLRAIVFATIGQLDTVLKPRSAGFDLAGAQGHEAFEISVSREEAEKLVWRLLATLAGATAPGEALAIALAEDNALAGLRIELPAALANYADVFSGATPAHLQTVNAGMFGASFTLRLARAEARAAGGDLVQQDDALALTLPLELGIAQDNANKDMDLDNRIAETG